MRSAFLVAAPHSGAGKTTLTLALIAALRARGLSVQPFKVGPDYIDPLHHAWAAGRPSHNLDTWMLPEEVNRRVYAAAAGADVAVVEGVMGLFDGVDGRREEGSSAHVARVLDLPVVLVVDARSMARSAAAVVRGFATFQPGVRVAAVVWNRVGSASHRRILDDALEAAGLPAAVGAVPRDAGVGLPERHLGLVTPEDADLPDSLRGALARLAETHVDLDALLAATRAPSPPKPPPAGRAPAERRRIGIARDAAFCFYYGENLRLLEEAGAELVPFRPADGDGVPEGVDGVYLGGGYPEVHAQRLSRNEAFRAGLHRLQEGSVPLYAECGGFMALCEALEDTEGRRHPMAGLFPAVARMTGRRFQLGYREVLVGGLARMRGLSARGHEFHYSRVEAMPPEVPRAYRVWNARSEELPAEGYLRGETLAGYLHLHFGSCPEFPRRFFRLG